MFQIQKLKKCIFVDIVVSLCTLKFHIFHSIPKPNQFHMPLFLYIYIYFFGKENKNKKFKSEKQEIEAPLSTTCLFLLHI